MGKSAQLNETCENLKEAKTFVCHIIGYHFRRH